MEMKLMINEVYAKHVPKDEEKFSFEFPIPYESIFDLNLFIRISFLLIKTNPT